jgi:hypothetical protein
MPWLRLLVLALYLYVIISCFLSSYFPTSFPCCSVFISGDGQAISLPAERQLPLNPHPPYQQLHLFPSLHTVQKSSSQAPYLTRKSPRQEISPVEKAACRVLSRSHPPMISRQNGTPWTADIAASVPFPDVLVALVMGYIFLICAVVD